MLMLITGGAGSGKTAFALALAEKFDRSGIWLVSHWPDKDMEFISATAFPWKIIETHPILPDILNTINLNANPFAMNRRVVVVDSIALWLYHEACEIAKQVSDESVMHERMEQRVQTLLDSIIHYQGTILVITNEVQLWDEQEAHRKLFAHFLPQVNAQLAARSNQLFLLTSGVAVELTRRQFQIDQVQKFKY